MLVETHGEETEATAELVQGLVRARKLPCFTAMVEDAYPVWHAICIFEEEMLAFAHRNPYCGHLDGWRIVVGRAQGVATVPKYVGWGKVQAWLEHGSVACVVEPGYGLICRNFDDFTVRHKAIPLASAPLSDGSGIVLNAAFRQIRELEAAL